MDVEVVQIMNMFWAGDHPMVDGANMSPFHTAWKQCVEE
jgi:hypothetical protein